MDRNGATVLHFSHVRPLRGRPQLGWGWTATVLRFQMLLVPDLEQSNATTNLQFCLSPTCGPTAGTQFHIKYNYLGVRGAFMLKIEGGKVPGMHMRPLRKRDDFSVFDYGQAPTPLPRSPPERKKDIASQ